MTSRNHSKVLSSLKQKGFVEERASRHIQLSYKSKSNEIEPKHTLLSHNKQDLNDFLINQMAKQCGLNKQQFLDLVDCPLSQEQYEEIIVKIN